MSFFTRFLNRIRNICGRNSDFPSADDLLKLSNCLYEPSVAIVERVSNKVLIKRVNAHSCFVLTLSENEDQLKCQVIGDNILENPIRFEVYRTCLNKILMQKASMIIDVPEGDLQDLEKACKFKLKSVLCVPIFKYESTNSVRGLICLVNKTFTEDDLDMVHAWIQFLNPVFHKAAAFQKERIICEKNQGLLAVLKQLLVHLDNVPQLMKDILIEAKSLMAAEKCFLFMLDKDQDELVAKVFDTEDNGNLTDESAEVRVPMSEGIAGHVASNGEILNVCDVYSHPLFYSKLDEETGFKTRNILCFPIKDEHSVIGVVQLTNKINEKHFSSVDEEIAEAFASSCAICLLHALHWKKVKDDRSRSRLSNGMISQSNVKVTEEEVLELITKVRKPHCADENFRSFTFNPRDLDPDEAVQAALSIFQDLGFVNLWRINKKTLTRFVLTVKQNYRNPPYHNWTHGFQVAHFSYLLLKNLDLMGNELTLIEGLALYVSCLCHDLDHRGTTSSFQVACKSVMAALYSSEGSVLERHHFAQTMAILHTRGCNILINLSVEEYTKCLDLIRHIILSTDLAHHFMVFGDLDAMVKEGYNVNKPEHHLLLLSLIVTSCDLSDQTKNWSNTKEIAKLIFREFFKQGDLERAMGFKPCDMMDRTKAQIPQLQISFLQQVVLPMYSLLTSIFPAMQPILDTITRHKDQWNMVEVIFAEFYDPETSAIEFLNDERVDIAAYSIDSVESITPSIDGVQNIVNVDTAQKKESRHAKKNSLPRRRSSRLSLNLHKQKPSL